MMMTSEGVEKAGSRQRVVHGSGNLGQSIYNGR